MSGCREFYPSTISIGNFTITFMLERSGFASLFSLSRKTASRNGAGQARITRTFTPYHFSVGALGIEPSLHEPESCVLPVYYAPVKVVRGASCIIPLYHSPPATFSNYLACHYSYDSHHTKSKSTCFLYNWKMPRARLPHLLISLCKKTANR
ncbi:MAG: hypothetical protein QG620_760 [Patescibacteria group bacterium]|nr:hypothetical protein [Patescibacteria group bacterium]